MFKTKSGKQPICTYNIRLYHGTNTLFEKPEVLYGSPDSDFGPGFYATESLDRAVKRALEKVLEEGGIPYVLIFDFDDVAAGNELRILRFSEDGSWGKFLMKHRTRTYEGPDFDIAIGPSADSKIIEIVRRYCGDYLSGDIDWNDFIDELQPSVYGKQYCFKSQDSIDRFLTHKGVVIYHGQD